MMTTGEKIAVLRHKAGLSQETLAEELGISRQAVSRWETSESLPDTEKIIRLSRQFGVSTDYLLLESTPESSSIPQETPTAPFLRWLHISVIGLAIIGTLLTLLGILTVTLWAILTHQWLTNYGRIGTALLCKWPGAVLFCGIMLLLLTLVLTALRTLLSKKQS